LLGYVVGRYYVAAKRNANPSNFTMACFSVIVGKFFKEDWLVAVFAGSQTKPRFVTPVAKSEYIAGFSLGIVGLNLSMQEVEKIGVLIPASAVVGTTDDGSCGIGGVVLTRYPESK